MIQILFCGKIDVISWDTFTVGDFIGNFKLNFESKNNEKYDENSNTEVSKKT